MSCKIWTQMAEAIFISGNKARNFLEEPTAIMRRYWECESEMCSDSTPSFNAQLLGSPGSVLGPVGLTKPGYHMETLRYSWSPKCNFEAAHCFLVVLNLFKILKNEEVDMRQVF
jgi:hypothetical protein